jgi:protocatechuate 3,4-dioxygenase beta subunit
VVKRSPRGPSFARKPSLIRLVLALAVLGLATAWFLGRERAGDPDRTHSPRAVERPAVLAGGDRAAELGDQRGALAALEVCTRDPDGKPLVGALVGVLAAGAADGQASLVDEQALGTTGAAGCVTVDRLRAGTYVVTASHPDWAPATRDGVRLAPVETTRLTLVLIAGGIVLSGRVGEAGGGPIGNARVVVSNLESAGSSFMLGAAVDGTGAFRVRVRAGRSELAVRADGYLPFAEQLQIVRPLVRDIRLSPAGRIAGRAVRRGPNTPVEGADVWLLRTDGESRRFPAVVRTDADGRFQFDQVESGDFEVVGRAGTLVGKSLAVSVAAARPVVDVILELSAGLTASGRVVDSAGRAVTGAEVTLAGGTMRRSLTTACDRGGAFSIGGITPGTYFLEAAADGFVPDGLDVELRGRDATGLRISLDEGMGVSGLVTDPQGAPAPGAEVFAVTSEPEGRSSAESTRTDDRGEYRFRRLIPGSVLLRAQDAAGLLASAGPVALGAGERRRIDLRLAAGATVSGTVRYHDGPAVALARVDLDPRGPRVGPVQFGITDEQGRFRITGVAAGRAELRLARARAPEPLARPETRAIEVSAGQQLTGADLIVVRRQSIAGLVSGPDGKPVAGATIDVASSRLARGGTLPSNPRGTSGPDGQFLIEDLAPEGVYSLQASHPDFSTVTVPAIRAGARDIRLRLAAITSAAGVVASSSGEPIREYRVFDLTDRNVQQTSTDEQLCQSGSYRGAGAQEVRDPGGAFTLDRRSPGPHALIASTATGQCAVVRVQLEEGERKVGLRLVLSAELVVRGRVVDHDTGAPMADVVVTRAGATESPDCRTDRDGTFHLVAGKRGRRLALLVAADRERYVPETVEIPAPPEHGEVDAGTVRLLPGEWRRRVTSAWFVPIGIDPVVTGGVAQVKAIRRGSPAHRAGVSPGEAILAVDGRTTEGLRYEGLKFLLSGVAGESRSLRLSDAAGVTRIVSIPVAPALPPPNPQP